MFLAFWRNYHSTSLACRHCLAPCTLLYFIFSFAEDLASANHSTQMFYTSYLTLIMPSNSSHSSLTSLPHEGPALRAHHAFASTVSTPKCNVTGRTLASTLSFISSFAAASKRTIENLNGDALRLVELYCSACARNTGTTLAFPLSAAGGFAGGGAGVSFSLPLSEAKGWVKDPENSLKEATSPTKCEMAEVLSNLSELRILGGMGMGLAEVFPRKWTGVKGQGCLGLQNAARERGGGFKYSQRRVLQLVQALRKKMIVRLAMYEELL